MPKQKKIVVDIEVFEDISQCTRILTDIVYAKRNLLTEEEITRLKYANKLLVSCNQLFQNAKPYDHE